jgi:hypothetical protein
LGGTTAGAGNVISGNGEDGVLVGASDTILLQGNYIGTDTAGGRSVANAGNGVEVGSFASNITIGGTALGGGGNVISGNVGDGLKLGTGSTLVEGNRIGIRAKGMVALGNGGNGVSITGSNNIIGGAGAGNIIAYNAGAGVLVNSGTGNLISQNSIFSNGALGIDQNEADDANNNQPAPVLSSAVLSSGTTTVQGTLTAAPNTTYTVEFFANTVCDPSGFGEGQTFLGSITVTTDNTGSATFSVPLLGVLSGQFITATATDPSNNTSEFSNCLAVTG